MISSFPRSLRILDKKAYDHVFQSAKKIGTRFLTVIYRENQLDHPRLGLIVAKKIVKRAHDRNRFKRIARESFRLRQQQLPSIDIILLSRQKVENVENEVLFSELKYVWKKIVATTS